MSKSDHSNEMLDQSNLLENHYPHVHFTAELHLQQALDKWNS